MLSLLSLGPDFIFFLSQIFAQKTQWSFFRVKAVTTLTYVLFHILLFKHTLSPNMFFDLE